MNVFDLAARISLDTSTYDKGLDDAKKKSSVFGDVLKANIVTKGIEVAIDGFKRLGAASIGFFKNSIGAYAEYEQLVGGVETLFKDSSDTIMQYAKEAYKTAGMSANQYMSTVTGFSASLLQSLGGDTAKAAEIGDMAVRDMSDKMSVRVKRVEPYQGCGAKKPQEMAVFR